MTTRCSVVFISLGFVALFATVASAGASPPEFKVTEQFIRKQKLGVCYDPTRHAIVHQVGFQNGDPKELRKVIDEDLKAISKYFGEIRTYYSSHYGVPIAEYAKKHNLKLYLGVFMTTQSWYHEQFEAAVKAAKDYGRETVSAILVGNENLKQAYGGPYTEAMLVKEIRRMKTRLREAGRGDIPVGTVQRVNEWLEKTDAMNSLAAESDIIGVTIYPWFSKGGGRNQIKLINILYDLMEKRYPNYKHKIRVTEIGWPSAGGKSKQGNVAAMMEAKEHFKNVVRWGNSKNPREKFIFSAYDRSDRNMRSIGEPYEKYFGIFDEHRQPKYIDDALAELKKEKSARS